MSYQLKEKMDSFCNNYLKVRAGGEFCSVDLKLFDCGFNHDSSPEAPSPKVSPFRSDCLLEGPFFTTIALS